MTLSPVSSYYLNFSDEGQVLGRNVVYITSTKIKLIANIYKYLLIFFNDIHSYKNHVVRTLSQIYQLCNTIVFAHALCSIKTFTYIVINTFTAVWRCEAMTSENRLYLE